MTQTQKLQLTNNSKIAVVGGGPAGSFFTHFLLRNAKHRGLKLEIDIYDKKDFSLCGIKGCNNCGGIIAESLVQEMATDGIKIPDEVMQEGVNTYILHTDVGTTAIETPLQEKRIAAVYRGSGPKGSENETLKSFDDFLRQKVVNAGATLIEEHVKSVTLNTEGKPVISSKLFGDKEYDLLVGAVGINSKFLESVKKNLGSSYQPAQKTKTKISEIYLGKERVEEYFGSAMHVFLLDIPNLRFAAIIPKGNYVTIALLSSEKIDKTMYEAFLNSPAVKKVFPSDVNLLKPQCQCSPGMNVGHAVEPYGDRIVLIGDSASAKLYKNGIGAAYITAREAAETVLLNGISKECFSGNYATACKKIDDDNRLGGIVFWVTGIIQKISFLKRTILRIVSQEQSKEPSKRHMSMVLWDTFTGSASYTDIFLRTLKPSFFLPLLRVILFGQNMKVNEFDREMFDEDEIDRLGKVYADGEEIITHSSDFIYIVQSGKVSITLNDDKKIEIQAGEYFGNMKLLEDAKCTTSVYSIGESTVLSIDKKLFIKKVEEDPFNVIGLLKKLSKRVKHSTELEEEVDYIDPESELVGDTYAKNETIYTQDSYGEHMYLIEDGEVDIIVKDNGVAQKIKTLKEGAFFGEMALFGHNIYRSSALAASDVRLRTIEDQKELQEILQDNPKLALQMIKKMFKKILR